jgi:hypothetical protein
MAVRTTSAPECPRSGEADESIAALPPASDLEALYRRRRDGVRPGLSLGG